MNEYFKFIIPSKNTIIIYKPDKVILKPKFYINKKLKRIYFVSFFKSKFASFKSII